MSFQEIKQIILNENDLVNDFELTYSQLLTLIDEERYLINKIDFKKYNDENFIIEAIYSSKKFPISLSSYLTNEDFVHKLLDSTYTNFNIIVNLLNDEYKEKYFNYIIETKNVIIDQSFNSMFFNSPKVALDTININVQKLNLFNECALTDEVVDLAIQKGYKFDYATSKVIYDNPKLVLYGLKKDINLVSKIPSSTVNDDIASYLINSEYNFYDLVEKFSDNKYFMERAVKRDVNVLNKINKGIINDYLIDYASKNGFIYEFLGESEPRKIISCFNFSDDMLDSELKNNSFLLKYDKLVLSSFLNGKTDIFLNKFFPVKESKYLDWMIDKAINRKVKINNIENKELLKNEKFKKYLEASLAPTKKSKVVLNNLQNIFKNEENLIYDNKLLYILSDDFINIFGENFVMVLTKYLIIPKAEFKIDILLESISVKDLVLTLKLLGENNINIKRFQKYVNVLSNNIDFIKIILDNQNKLTIEDKNILRFMMNTDDFKNLKSISDLKKYKPIFDSNNIKDKIYYILCGCNKSVFASTLNTCINFNSLLELKNYFNTSSEEYKIIENYIPYFAYLDYINLTNDKEELSTIYSDLLNNDTSGISIHISDIMDMAKHLYSNAYKNSLTDLDSMKYREIEGVKVIDFDGQDFSMIAHVIDAFKLNSYVSTGLNEIYDREYGKSYICTSYINQNNITLSNRRDSNIVIFDDFNPDQLISFSHNDIHSEGESNNSLEVTYGSFSFEPPEELIMKTKSYNEFTFYRQSSSGKKILPKALLVYNDASLPIDLARKFNLPIVVINVDKYKNKNQELYNKYKKELLSYNLSNIDKYIPICYKLNIALSKEEINIIKDAIDEYNIIDKINIYKILEKYNYNVELIFDHNYINIKRDELKGYMK